MEKLETYERLSTKYLAEAESLLGKGDSVQAGEKIWGSVAEALKGEAARRGISLRTHAELWNFALRLDKEHPDKEFYSLFTVADHMHSNFYEDELPAEAVAKALAKAKEFVAKLQQL